MDWLIPIAVFGVLGLIATGYGLYILWREFAKSDPDTKLVKQAREMREQSPRGAK